MITSKHGVITGEHGVITGEHGVIASEHGVIMECSNLSLVLFTGETMGSPERGRRGGGSK